MCVIHNIKTKFDHHVVIGLCHHRYARDDDEEMKSTVTFMRKYDELCDIIKIP